MFTIRRNINIEPRGHQLSGGNRAGKYYDSVRGECYFEPILGCIPEPGRGNVNVVRQDIHMMQSI